MPGAQPALVERLPKKKKKKLSWLGFSQKQQNLQV